MPDFIPFPIKLFYISSSLIILAEQIVAVDYMNINIINQIRYNLQVLNLSLDELKMQNCSSSQQLKDCIKHHSGILAYVHTTSKL